MSGTLHGFGLGVASENANGDILDVFFRRQKRRYRAPQPMCFARCLARLTTRRYRRLPRIAAQLTTRPWRRSQRGSEIVGEGWLYQH